MRRPNFRKAVKNNKCSGKMFAQAYPRPAGHINHFYFNYCFACEGFTCVSYSTNLCEYCTNNPKNIPPLPKFELGRHVKCSISSGCNLEENTAVVIGSRYVNNEQWSGWIYKLINKDLTEPIESSEIWLELATTTL